MTTLPLLVSGKVFDSNNTELVGALVTAVNTTTNSNTIRATTDSSGYILDIANCSYSTGDTIKMVASYEGWGYVSYTFTAGNSFTHNFTLDESEGGSGYQYQPRYQLKKAILTSFDGEDIKHSNPLPVSILNSLIPDKYDYIVMTYDSNDNLTKAIFKIGGSSGVTIATLTLTYDSNDNCLTVTKT